MHARTGFSAVLPSVLLAALSGCKGCQPEPKVTSLLDDVSPDVSGLFVGTSIGVGEVDLPIYGVNGLSAAVPSDSIVLSSVATLTEGAVTPDSLGWATAHVQPGVVGAYAVDGTLGTEKSSGTAFSVASDVGEYGFPAVDPEADAEDVSIAGGGIVHVHGGDVRWCGFGRTACAHVLALPQPVKGMEAVNIDGDGVLDLLVWSEGHFVVLRGRAEGGLVWGAGWTPKSGSFITGTATDLDGDAKIDILITESDGGTSNIAPVIGDGVWGFEQTFGLAVDEEVFAASGQDYDGDGTAEITLLTENGHLPRWAFIGGEWLSASTAEYSLGFDANSRFLPSVDLTGDGSPDIIATGPLSDGSGWQAVVVSAGAASPTQYNLYPSLDPKPATLSVTIGDLTGDGEMEAILSEPGRILRADWSTVENTFTISALDGFPDSKGIVTGDVTGDGVGDVVVGGGRVRVYTGEIVEDDPETEVDESSPWKVHAAGGTSYNLGMVGLPWFGDFTGDAIVDAVMYTRDGAGLNLVGYYGDPETDAANETFRSPGRAVVAADGNALDLAVCDHDVYALVATAGVIRLYEYALDDVAGLHGVGTVEVGGTHVACGAFADAPAVVVAEDGGVEWIDGTNIVGTDSLGGNVGDIAAADDDGDGVATLQTCADSCTLAVGDFDDDGLEDVLEANDGGVGVTLAGVDVPVASSGAVWAGDADGDGVDDIVVGSGGVVSVRRALGGVVSPPVARYLFRPVADAPAFGDLDGNGVPDAFFVGQDDDTTDDVSWDGFLLYAESADPSL